MINLFTTYYYEHNSERRKELNVCLRKNSNHELISNVYVLSESKNNDYLSKRNVFTIHILNRPKFNDFFNVINNISGDKDINIIANTDIYFDDSLILLDKIKLTDSCFSLTRWDVWKDGRARLTEIADSQDCWIFQGKIKDVSGNFLLGAPGCDNRLAHEITEAGYFISNPSISIKTYHLHISSFRPNSSNWFSDDVYIGPPHKYIIPDTLDSFLKTGFIHILTNKKRFSDYLYKLKIKRWYIYKIYRDNYGIHLPKLQNVKFYLKIKTIICLFYFRIPFEKFILMLISPYYYKKYIKR